MKLLVVLALIGLLVGAVACVSKPPLTPPVQQQPLDVQCKTAGYVPAATANVLVNLTNKLADIVNVCSKAANITQEVPHVAYFPESS